MSSNPWALEIFGDTGCHPERSEGSLRPATRSFASLRMTTRTSLKSAHGKPYLQMSVISQSLHLLRYNPFTALQGKDHMFILEQPRLSPITNARGDQLPVEKPVFLDRQSENVAPTHHLSIHIVED